MNSELKKAAYHESGHALIYHILGQRIKYIEINDSGYGYCAIDYGYKPSHYGTYDNAEHEINMFHWALKCLSGYVSEYKMAGIKMNVNHLFDDFYLEDDVEPETDSESLIDEMNKINAVIGEEYYGLDFIHSVWEATIDIIHKPNSWKAIEILSEELLQSEDNFLLGRKVHEILDGFNFDMIKLEA